MYRGRDNVHKVRQGSVCNSSNTDRCEQLKTAGISVLVETLLLLFAVILTIIPLIAKKKGKHTLLLDAPAFSFDLG